MGMGKGMGMGMGGMFVWLVQWNGNGHSLRNADSIIPLFDGMDFLQKYPGFFTKISLIFLILKLIFHFKK